MNTNDFIAVTSKGNRVKEGGAVKSFRGERWIFLGVSRAPDGPSTGRVYVRNPRDGWQQEFFPSVFNLTIVPIVPATGGAK